MITFGVQIKLNDFEAPVTADASIGLYNVGSPAGVVNFGAGGKYIYYWQSAWPTLDIDIKIGETVFIRAISNPEMFEYNFITGITPMVAPPNYWRLELLNNIKYSYQNYYPTLTFASKFKWIQNQIPGLNDTWCSTMLTENGIDDYTRSIDTARGGNISNVGKSKVTIKNTEQFNKTISSLGINLNGAIAEICLFNPNACVQWAGICQQPEWTSTEYSIPIDGLSRNVNIGQLISQTNFPNATNNILGKMVPITIGNFNKAELIRVANKTTTYTTAAQEQYGTITISGLEAGLSTFPVTSTYTAYHPAPSYRIQLTPNYRTVSATDNGVELSHSSETDIPYFAGAYIYVVSGTG